MWAKVVYNDKPKIKNILAISYVDKKKSEEIFIYIKLRKHLKYCFEREKYLDTRFGLV